MVDLETSPVIAAVRTMEDFAFAVDSPIKIIFLLQSNILNLKEMVEHAREKNKNIFVHIDFTEGIEKDRFGIEYVAMCGVDGIISTRANVIKLAKECNLITIQRFFIVDSHSIDTAVESIKSSKPDMIEIMPGILARVISTFKNKVKVPIITGGLIEMKSDIINAIKAGAAAISTTKRELWVE
mgnify:CR=1 FL=1